MIKLKINGHTYQITSADKFLDNGVRVFLVSQSLEPMEWGKKPEPMLSKEAERTISMFDRVQHDHKFNSNVTVFNLDF